MTVIVLNADYSFLNTISWQSAICLWYKGKVEVLKYTDRLIRTVDKSLKIKVPKIVRLMKIVRAIYKTHVPYSKRNIFIRDGYKCGYCGVKIPERSATVDHIVPKDLGGKSTWENCITSCKKCNNKKGNTPLRNTGMFLKIKPYQPTISEFLRFYMKSHGIDKILKDLMESY